ncbi:unnamed protein product [Caenorhabditis brenneri]
MSCLRIPRSPFSLLSSSSKREKRNVAHDAHAPKYFMDGNPTSTSTFELGSDGDSFNDENSSLDSHWSNEESIIASSRQNSTIDFSLSAPSSIARNQILACSTPKDQVSLTQQDADKSEPQLQSHPIRKPYAEALCETRRDIYRNGMKRLRNMGMNYPPRPGTENIKTSYYRKEDIPKEAYGSYKTSMEKRLEEQQTAARHEKLGVFKEHASELFLSIVTFLWQLFYVLEVIPNDNALCYCANIAVCVTYGIVFMAPHPIMWAIVCSSFLMYMSFVWLFGASCAFGHFVYASVFAKSILTMLQAFLHLAS